MGEAELCVVVDAGDVVAAVLDRDALRSEAARVEEVARFGLTTVRPSEERHALDERLAAAGVDHVVVTDPEGRLLGLYRR